MWKLFNAPLSCSVLSNGPIYRGLLVYIPRGCSTAVGSFRDTLSLNSSSKATVMREDDMETWKWEDICQLTECKSDFFHFVFTATLFIREFVCVAPSSAFPHKPLTSLYRKTYPSHWSFLLFFSLTSPCKSVGLKLHSLSENTFFIFLNHGWNDTMLCRHFLISPQPPPLLRLRFISLFWAVMLIKIPHSLFTLSPLA